MQTAPYFLPFSAFRRFTTMTGDANGPVGAQCSHTSNFLDIKAKQVQSQQLTSLQFVVLGAAYDPLRCSCPRCIPHLLLIVNPRRRFTQQNLIMNENKEKSEQSRKDDNQVDKNDSKPASRHEDRKRKSKKSHKNDDRKKKKRTLLISLRLH